MALNRVYFANWPVVAWVHSEAEQGFKSINRLKPLVGIAQPSGAGQGALADGVLRVAWVGDGAYAIVVKRLWFNHGGWFAAGFCQSAGNRAVVG